MGRKSAKEEFAVTGTQRNASHKYIS